MFYLSATTPIFFLRLSLLIISLFFTAIICPLEWPYALIPVLPIALQEFIESPVPYFIGINTRFEEMDLRNASDVTIYDIDARKFRYLVKFPLPKFDGLKAKIEKLFEFFKPPLDYTAEIEYDEMLACSKIIDLVHKTINECILSRIKNKDISVTKQGALDTKKNKDTMLTLWMAEDKEFFRLFADTQMLSSYIEASLKGKTL